MDQQTVSAVLTSLLAAVLLFAVPIANATGDYDQGLQAYAAGDYDRAIASWSGPALENDPRAQFALGVLTMRGIGVPRDEVAAVGHYRRAAESGFASAQFNLGLAHFTGRGVEKEPAKAQYWWQLAAEQGHAVAQYNLAAILWSGDGVPMDQARAMHWFRIARSRGSEEASNFLLTLFEPMYKVLTENTLERVRGEDKRSIPLIDEFGLYKLGLQAAEEENFPQAFGYWEPLALDGHADSQFRVAQLYEKGLGVAQNFEQAITWYDRAAQQNHGAAQYRLGIYHMNESPDPNKALGFYWIQSAADNGNVEARQYIESN